ncbi:MAG: RDD family protein [Egibacteraceae bacterium]
MTDTRPFENTLPPPEGTPQSNLPVPPAGSGGPEQVVGRRIGAALIDLVVLMVLSFLVATLFGGASAGGGEVGFALTGGPALMLMAAIPAYYIILEGLRGQTVGKMLLGIRVVAADGTPAGWGAVVVRTLLRIVDGFFFYLVGLIVMLASPRKQRVGDMAAKTLVVRA